MRVCPGGHGIVAKEQHLTATLQLPLHEFREELNGLGDLLDSVRTVNQEVHDQEVRLRIIDPLQLAADVTARQRGPMEELDEASLIAGVLGHADHLIRVVANDPN